MVALLLGTAGCATAPRPNPSANLYGEWSVVAVNGEPTGGGESFWMSVDPPNASAQFGCNQGGGSARVERGWLIPGDWIITVAGCLDERVEQFERRGFRVLSKPAAIEAYRSGVRLRNGRGSISLRPLSPPDLKGSWAVIGVNGSTLGYPSLAQIRFGASDFDGSFGCNRMRGYYRQDGRTVRVSQASKTERGCLTPAGEPAPSMALEDEGLAVLASNPTIRRLRTRVVTLTSVRGTLQLQRQP